MGRQGSTAAGVRLQAARRTESHPDAHAGHSRERDDGNLLLVVLNLPLVGLWVSLLRVPYPMLFPAIMVFSAVGIYSSSNVSFDIYLTAIFGILGIAWRLLECRPVPMLLGFVLGPMMEENLRRALQVSRGDLSVFVTRLQRRGAITG